MKVDPVISPHFFYSEMTATSVRHGMTNEPGAIELDNLRFLATELLEPLRAIFGPMHTTSAYRSPAVNLAIGGSLSSAHVKGCAWDGVPLRQPDWSTVIMYLTQRKDLPIDQVIYEYGRWIHIGTRPGGLMCRHQFLMIFEKGRYEPWNEHDIRITR